MKDKFKLRELLQELPKSIRMAKEACNGGIFPFFVCSEIVQYSNFCDFKEEALILSTGGKTNIHYCNSEFSASTDTWLITTAKDKLDTKYAYYFLESKKRLIEKKGFQGSGLKHLDKDFVRDIEILLPNLHEQKKIASVLTAIDQKISLLKKKNEKMVYLLKALLRNSLLEKNCEMLIPLSEIGTWKGGGTPSKSIPEYWNGWIPWVSPKDMYKNRIFDTEDFITPEAINNSATSLVKKGSILFVVRSGILRNKLPIAFAEKDLTINQDLKSLHLNSRWNEDFVFYFLQSNADQIRSSCMKVGTTVESISSDLLMEYHIPYFSNSVQMTMGRVARSIDKLIELGNNSISSTINLKKALLQDLLSKRQKINK